MNFLATAQAALSKRILLQLSQAHQHRSHHPRNLQVNLLQTLPLHHLGILQVNLVPLLRLHLHHMRRFN